MTEAPDRRLAPVVRLPAAKLNLTLAVGGRRPDGFHQVETVMVPLRLADRLSAAPLPSGPDRLHVVGADLGPAADNLVLRAVAALRAAVGGTLDGPALPGRPATPPLAIRLEKRIPVAAGLGGGSSDAAAALEAAMDAWALAIDGAVVARVAAGLGSDVPFGLVGGPAIGRGRGDVLEPLPWPRGEPVGVLLVTPAVAVPTASVFAAFAGGHRPSGHGAARQTSRHLADELRTGLTTAELLVRAGLLASANDLWPAAAFTVPGLTEARRGLRRIVGRPVGLSGSGPTLWALYPSEAAAGEAVAIVLAAIEAGELVLPGRGPAFVAGPRFGGPAPAVGPGDRPSHEAAPGESGAREDR